MKIEKPLTLKGFRDFMPAEMRVRNYVEKVMRNTFESFGFEPLETPTLEYASTLLGKYGKDADKLVFTFNDRGGRQVGLNYDLTVPTARVLANIGKSIPLPFKRYQIQKAFRAEKPQKGRYREFVMCDIDIIGTKSPQSDAEILLVDYTVLKNLGFKNFKILINDRDTLFKNLEIIGITDKNKQLSIIRTLDKMDKIQKEGVVLELKAKRVELKVITSLFKQIENSKPSENLAQIMVLAKQMGVPEQFLQFSPTLARGLDYYTGMIVEVIVEELKIGSLCGGGRYDNLIERLGGPNIPATGNTVGFERICDVIGELNLLSGKIPNTTATILITLFSEGELEILGYKTAEFLRLQGITTETYLEPNDPISKQIKYASSKNIPFVAIIGPDEVEKEVVTIKNLVTREQKSVKMEELPNVISNF